MLAAIGQEERVVTLPCVHIGAGDGISMKGKKTQARKTCWRPGLPRRLCRVWVPLNRILLQAVQASAWGS